MAMLSFGGIDVSKDRLDVMLLPEAQSSSVSNDAAGWAKLVEQLRGSSIAAIGIEASGGYERGVTRALLAAGMPVRQVNPFKLRQFARASGILAKNDPLDARMIASFVAVMPTRPARRQAVASERLVQMLAVRRQLSAQKIAAENASRLLEDPMLSASARPLSASKADAIMKRRGCRCFETRSWECFAILSRPLGSPPSELRLTCRGGKPLSDLWAGKAQPVERRAMQIFPDMLEDVTPDNIQQLCADQVSEGTELELKSDLPTRDGRLDTWHGGGPIGDYARNEIAEEIIAFANTLGGTLCVGIAETSDHPKRADSPRPLPRVHELARRLRQSVYAIIDPPLPVLEAVGVELQAGSGVVLLRVPPSRRRPHRHQVSKEVFVRRNDETVRITMREIQELTMQAVSEATRIEATISKRREEFRKGTQEWLSAPRDPSGKVFVAKGAGFHVLALPTIQIDLGRVVGRPRLTNLAPTVNVQLSNGQQEQCHWPWRPTDWKPQLRSIASTFKRRDSVASYSLKTNGTCELEFKLKATEEQPGLFIGWLVGALGFMLAWMERVRTEAGVPVEFACAIQIPIFKGPVSLVQYGVSTFAQSQGALLPKGFHEFPLVSVGAAEEFPAILRRFNEDLWDLAGYGVQQAAPAFSFTPAV